MVKTSNFNVANVLGVGSIPTDVFHFFLSKSLPTRSFKRRSHNKENTILIGSVGITITKICNNTRFEVPKGSEIKCLLAGSRKKRKLEI